MVGLELRWLVPGKVFVSATLDFACINILRLVIWTISQFG